MEGGKPEGQVPGEEWKGFMLGYLLIWLPPPGGPALCHYLVVIRVRRGRELAEGFVWCHFPRWLVPCQGSIRDRILLWGWKSCENRWEEKNGKKMKYLEESKGKEEEPRWRRQVTLSSLQRTIQKLKRPSQKIQLIRASSIVENAWWQWRTCAGKKKKNNITWINL